jgi:hypothetical protein
MTQMKLPIVDYTGKLYPQNSLKDKYLICSQHVLTSICYLLKSVIKLGMPPENIAILGKCYSCNMHAYEQMKKLNIYVSPLTFKYDSHEAFDLTFDNCIDLFLQNCKNKIQPRKDEKLIVLDDGGHLLPKISKVYKNHKQIKGIEQTSAGYNKLKSSNLNFPIINIARSFSKLHAESSFIAKSQVDSLKKICDIKGKKVLIIGRGYIGTAIKEHLDKYCHIDFFDIIDELSTIKKIDFSLYDIIIGATGKISFDIDQNSLPKNKKIIFVSLSSSDREFNAVKFRRLFPQNHNCHLDLTINKITLINSGFPINFFGSKSGNIPSADIQLTIALLLAGIAGNKSEAKGFIELDTSVENNILDRWINYKLENDVEKKN